MLVFVFYCAYLRCWLWVVRVSKRVEWSRRWVDLMGEFVLWLRVVLSFVVVTCFVVVCACWIVTVMCYVVVLFVVVFALVLVLIL